MCGGPVVVTLPQLAKLLEQNLFNLKNSLVDCEVA
jgi:hypothetical protein